MTFSDHISKETIQNTIEFWSPRYGYTISEEEAREIVVNLRGFFDILIKWDREDKEKKAQDKK